MPIDFQALAAPFPPSAVHWRVGSTNKDKTRGLALCYLDARDVMDRLDEVCGPDRWQCRYTETPKGRVLCEIGIDCHDTANHDGDWVWKADGAGDSDHEPEKGGLSDAFKRAAVRWGIGRYLYRINNPWVAIEPMGRSYKIAAGEVKRLQTILPGSQVENGAPCAPEPEPERPRCNLPIMNEAAALAEQAKRAPDLATLAQIDDEARKLMDSLPDKVAARLKAVLAEAHVRLTTGEAA